MKKLLLCLVLSASAALAAEGYKVIQKIHIGGSGTFDRVALDDAARRLYIANDNRVVVVDIDSGKVAGEISGIDGVHGIAIAPDLGRGFVAGASANEVTTFDLKTLKPLGKASTGGEPGPVLFEPKTGRVFAFNLANEDGTATVIDAKTGEAAGKVTLGGKATAAVTDGSGKIWIALQITSEDWNVSSEVGIIDAEKLTLLSHSPIAPCDRPTAITLDAKNNRLFAVCTNSKMAVADESGKLLSTVVIGKSAGGVGIDPASGLVFTSDASDGTVTVVKDTGGAFDASEKVPTARNARVLAVDPKTHNVYLPAVEYPAGGGTTAVPDSFEVLVVGK